MKFKDFIKNYSKPLKLSTDQINFWLKSNENFEKTFLMTKFVRKVNNNNAIYNGLYKDQNNKFRICTIQIWSDINSGFKIDVNGLPFGDPIDSEKDAFNIFKRL